MRLVLLMLMVGAWLGLMDPCLAGPDGYPRSLVDYLNKKDLPSDKASRATMFAERWPNESYAPGANDGRHNIRLLAALVAEDGNPRAKLSMSRVGKNGAVKLQFRAGTVRIVESDLAAQSHAVAANRSEANIGVAKPGVWPIRLVGPFTISLHTLVVSLPTNDGKHELVLLGQSTASPPDAVLKALVGRQTAASLPTKEASLTDAMAKWGKKLRERTFVRRTLETAIKSWAEDDLASVDGATTATACLLSGASRFNPVASVTIAPIATRFCVDGVKSHATALIWTWIETSIRLANLDPENALVLLSTTQAAKALSQIGKATHDALTADNAAKLINAALGALQPIVENVEHKGVRATLRVFVDAGKKYVMLVELASAR